MTDSSTGSPATVQKNAPWAWFQANGLPNHIPDDAALLVDEHAGTITVEVLARNADGQLMLHGKHLMTTVETFPLKVPPPAGLVAAYHHTVARLRAERDAAEAIRRETAFRIAEHIAGVARRRRVEAERIGDDCGGWYSAGLAAAAVQHVWDAMGWLRPPEEEPPAPAGTP